MAVTYQQLQRVVNFFEFTRIYLNSLEFAVFEKRLTDPRTHGRIDPRMDKASYRVAFQLKTSLSMDASMRL